MTTTTISRTTFIRWRTAIFAIFFVCGIALATWASRLPAVKASLGIGNLEIGLALLCMGIASISGLSMSAVLVARFGSRTTMLGSMIAIAAGFVIAGLGAETATSLPLVIAGLVVAGLGTGCLDVTMNVEGAMVEQHQQRTIMPLFHAFFSFGTVVGAAAGTLAASVSLGVLAHLVIFAVVMVVVGLVSIANVPKHNEADAEQSASADAAPATWRERLHTALEAWREPRTYAIGVVMLGMSFAEGGANDWLALGVAESHGAGEAMGAAALAVFSVSMTVVRVFGGPLVDRFGRVLVLRVLAVAAASGIALYILAPSIPLVFAGAALWGVGASLGFPLGMSAASDDPEKAAARVSAAATIGYVAFLGGPPVLGFVSEHIGLLNTLYILVALVLASGIASGAARPLPKPETATATAGSGDDEAEPAAEAAARER